MTRPTIHNKEQVIEAIKGSGGIKAAIAKRLGVSRWTIDNYIDRWTTVKRVYEEECEAVLDMAETNLIQEMRDRNFQAIKFYLVTKGKRRGYVERQELTGADGGSININATISSAIKQAYANKNRDA